MGILSGELIEKMVPIEPFHKDALQPASYDLRLGKRILVSPIGAERGRAIDLDKEKDHKYVMNPGQFVAALTEEVLALPDNVSGRFGVKSSVARKGLIAFGGIQIDPGFRGRLAISLFNVGPESIELELGAPVFSTEFHTLEESTKRPYAGEYQDQQDFPAEQYNFTLSAQTVSLAEIPNLRSRIEELSSQLKMIDILREEIEELLEDTDRDKELKEEVKEKLKKSLRLVSEGARGIPASEVARKLGLTWQ